MECLPLRFCRSLLTKLGAVRGLFPRFVAMFQYIDSLSG